MGKIAFVFAGQGAQTPGMGKDVCDAIPAAAEVFAKADAVREGTSRQCFEADKAELMETKNTQPCVFTKKYPALRVHRGPCHGSRFGGGRHPRGHDSGIFSG